MRVKNIKRGSGGATSGREGAVGRGALEQPAASLESAAWASGFGQAIAESQSSRSGTDHHLTPYSEVDRTVAPSLTCASSSRSAAAYNPYSEVDRTGLPILARANSSRSACV